MSETKPKLPNVNHDAIFQNRFTDTVKISIHVQDHGVCREFERNVAECVEAYGFYRGQVKCEALMHDLAECLLGEKRRSRNDILFGEMTRQVEKGERKFEEPPFLAFIQ